MREFDLTLAGGGTLHCYEQGGGDRAVFWHHGTPNVGEPPAPLFEVAEQLGIRWLSFDRPGYGGSTPVADRSIGSVAGWVERVADELGLDRFGHLGHSGGGSHAVAAATLLADRTTAVVSVSGLAPYGSSGLDWFAQMAASGVAGLTAARAGRAAKEAYEASADELPAFTDADFATLEGPWGWLGSVAGRAMAGGPGGLIDDDLAYVRPWGCDPASLTAPALFVHGGADQVVPAGHSRWLAAACPDAELWLSPADGHISVLKAAESALRWLAERG